MTKDEAINRFKGIKESFSISVAQSNFYPSKDIQDELCDIAIESLSAETEWIPCSERLPSKGRYYLCCDKGYLPFIAHYFDGQWHDFDGTTPSVDAWMPLPESYKGRREE